MYDRVLSLDEWEQICHVTRLVRFPRDLPPYFRRYVVALLRANGLRVVAGTVRGLDPAALAALHQSLVDHQDQVAFLRRRE